MGIRFNYINQKSWVYKKMATKKTVSFSASFELDNKINEVFERLEKTDWVLDKTLVNKSTLIRSAILEGLAVLEKKYLGSKNQ